MRLVKSVFSRKRKNKILTKGFLWIVVLLTSTGISAQNNNEHFFDIDSTRIKDSLAKLPPEPKLPYLYTNYGVVGLTQIISNDYFVGCAIGYLFEKPMLETRVNFEFRPFFKKTLEKENDTLVYQYRQKDYMLSLSLEKQFGKMDGQHKLRPYFQLNVGWAFGNYRGWDKNPDKKIILAPGAGAVYSLSQLVHVKLGYQYFKPLTKGPLPHHIYLQFQFYLRQ